MPALFTECSFKAFLSFRQSCITDKGKSQMPNILKITIKACNMMITRCNILCIHTVNLFLMTLNWQSLVGRCLQELLKNQLNTQA